MVELTNFAAKPMLATPLFTPLAVTLHLNAVSEVFVVEIADKPEEDSPEETMPMDAMACDPATAKLDSVAANKVLVAVMNAILFTWEP